MFCPKENRCRRFKANIFNKRKCQNCFRTVESHTISEFDLHATKPVKAGWLLLAPEGIDFLNPSNKNRKWQRRYFILYEHGLLRYSLDEMPGTLPQGSVNMSQCSDVLDAASQTSFCNSLRMCFSDRDYYIKTENAENISGWKESLLVLHNTAKMNLRKRRRENTIPQHNLKKHAVSERNQVSDGCNRNYIINTSCSSVSKSSTKSPETSRTTMNNYSLSSMDIKQNGTIGDVYMRVSTEAIKVSQWGGKDRNSSYMEGVEVGPPLPSSPGAGLQEQPKELDGKAKVHSSSRMSHTVDTSSITSDPFSLLTQLPAHISTNAKSREGIDSGYSSLEKNRSDAEDPHTGPDQDYRCDQFRERGKIISVMDEKKQQQEHARGSHLVRRGRGDTHRTHSPGREEVYRLFGKHRRRSQVISQFEQENGMPFPTSTCSSAEYEPNERANRSTTRALARGQGAAGVSASTCRRSKSLERNLAECAPTPDLLNFKKGWMTRLGEDGKWRKHWFVLNNQSLRFYRDSVAEEAADLDGEINLSTCYDITDFPVQRNYGFQIHTKDGAFKLCAMTSGIRRNWIQAVMKNVQTSVAPDVTCSVPQKVPTGMDSECKYPFVWNSSCTEEEEEEEGKRSSIAERRKEGRYKTFDWAEFSYMQNKRETLSRQSGIESEFSCGDYVPPAPASTPEEPLPRSSTVVHAESACSITKPTEASPLMVRSSIIASKPRDQKNTEPDSVNVCNGISNAEMEEKKEADLYTPTSPATFSSASVQTERQWESELQTLHNELKAAYERSERERREFKLSETRYQAELNGSLYSQCETESRLQKTEATLKEREDELEDLRNSLGDVSGRLKAAEEAQALKDVRLQRHLRLLEESQERERRSLGDSLEHAEKRGKELEERLVQTEAKLQKMPTGGNVEHLARKCQELQNQLDESDGELCRLQARLENEETLYYDIEHNYEQVCEELEFVRGKLQKCERDCEERFRIRLEQQEEKLNRKERELQDVFLKIGCPGMTLEMTEHMWLKDANQHLQKNSLRTLETNFGFGDSEKRPVAQADESEQVISVIQALENKLCDTEERLQEITVHLQHQQQMLADETEDQWSVANVASGPGVRDNPNGNYGAIELDRTATDAKAKSAANKMLDFVLQEALHEEERPEERLSQWMTSRMLYLEALVIQKIASALEHPSKRLLEGLTEMHSQTKTLSESSNERHEGRVTRNYSQLFSYYQEMGEAGCSLDEHEISSMCLKAELAYITYTNHLHNPLDNHGSHGPFYLGSEVTPLDPKEGTSSKTRLQRSDIRLPELVPSKEQKKGEWMGCFPVDRDRLVMELRTQARSLQAISKQLHPLEENNGVPSEVSPILLRTVLFQAILTYVTSRLHVALQRRVDLCKDLGLPAVCQCHRLEAVLQEQAEGYEEKLREDRVVIEVAKLARISAETDAQIKGQEVQQMKVELERKLQDLQKIHEEEIDRLHEYYTQSQSQTTTPTDSSNGDCQLSVTTMKERISELELQIRCLEDEIRRGDPNTLREAYEKELETLKVTCELGFSSMEQSHQRVIEEMQRQHQIEVEKLLEEKERVLQEETNATIAAIEAMRKAHKEELEKSQKAQQNGVNTDINKLRAQFKDELDSLHRELGVLSEQYSQKCLENAHLNRTIETERQALSSVERDNQELLTRNQELNKRLVAELSIMHSPVNGSMDKAELFQGKDVIQLEVALRVKESEIQCLKQEISSLKEELQAANRHCKQLLNELTVSGVKCQTSGVKRGAETFRQRSQSYDVMKSKSNPDFLNNHLKPNQPTRSKSQSLKERLSVQERVKLFE